MSFSFQERQVRYEGILTFSVPPKSGGRTKLADDWSTFDSLPFATLAPHSIDVSGY